MVIVSVFFFMSLILYNMKVFILYWILGVKKENLKVGDRRYVRNKEVKVFEIIFLFLLLI